MTKPPISSTAALSFKDLEKRFMTPKDFEWGEFRCVDGARMRYGVSKPPQGIKAKGAICLMHGFSEFIEKYFELIRDLNTKGYSVYTFDWRGQGRSTRYLTDTPTIPFSTGFDVLVHDAKYFIDTIVPNDQPRSLWAHSMGGHLALRYLHDYPDDFAAAVLSAPMIDIYMPYPRWLARVLLRLAVTLGFSKRSATKNGDWSDKNQILEEDIRSRDPKRRLVQYLYTEHDDSLRMGNASYGWVYHALKSIGIMAGSGYFEAIKTPVLIGNAGDDAIVDTDAIVKAADRLENAALVNLRGAQHEIFMERDAIRDVFLREALSFIENQR